VLRKLMGGADSVSTAVGEQEEWRVANTFAAELTRARGAAGMATRALNVRDERAQRRRQAATAKPTSDGDGDGVDLVVCASGNLALVFFPDIEGRADLETLNERYPGMIDALAHHPGISVVMVRSSDHGPLVIGKSGVRYLDHRNVDGEDPVKELGKYAAEALKRLDKMSNCGDLVVLSMIDADTEQVAAFEELIGSHGGLGGPQTEPLILYPADWELDKEPLVGAPAIYEQLMAWLGRSIEQTGTKAADKARVAA
jgi:hypothetical protein